MTFAHAQRLLNSSIQVMRILGWSWRWAEWWVDYNSSWEPLLEEGQKESKMTKEELRIVDSTRESRCEDARKGRLATLGAALRERLYDTEVGFDRESLDRALRAILSVRSLAGPLAEYEVNFLVDWLGRAYRSRSRLLGYGEDKICPNPVLFCVHIDDHTSKFTLGNRPLPGKKVLVNEVFESGIQEVDDFLKTEVLTDEPMSQTPPRRDKTRDESRDRKRKSIATAVKPTSGFQKQTTGGRTLTNEQRRGMRSEQLGDMAAEFAAVAPSAIKKRQRTGSKESSVLAAKPGSTKLGRPKKRGRPKKVIDSSALSPQRQMDRPKITSILGEETNIDAIPRSLAVSVPPSGTPRRGGRPPNCSILNKGPLSLADLAPPPPTTQPPATPRAPSSPTASLTLPPPTAPRRRGRPPKSATTSSPQAVEILVAAGDVARSFVPVVTKAPSKAGESFSVDVVNDLGSEKQELPLPASVEVTAIRPTDSKPETKMGRKRMKRVYSQLTTDLHLNDGSSKRQRRDVARYEPAGFGPMKQKTDETELSVPSSRVQEDMDDHLPLAKLVAGRREVVESSDIADVIYPKGNLGSDDVSPRQLPRQRGKKVAIESLHDRIP
jgi:hypothetical protein